MKGYTELAAERREVLSSAAGVSEQTEERDGILIRRIGIKTQEAAEAIGQPVGNYVSLELRDSIRETDTDRTAKHLTAELKTLLPGGRAPIFAVGLGNPHVTVDALGPCTAAHLLPTRHLPQRYLTSVTVLAPGVPSFSGLETAEQVAALVKTVRPRAVLLIDALVSRHPERVGRVIQLTDTGILPGSGTRGRPTAVNAEILGVPTVAIGVPMAASSEQEGTDRFLLVPSDLDALLEQTAALLGFAVNCALQPNLSPDDIARVMP